MNWRYFLGAFAGSMLGHWLARNKRRCERCEGRGWVWKEATK